MKNDNEQEIRFSGVAYKLEEESYEEYKARQKMLKAIQNKHLKGTMFWPSKIMGTYYRTYKGREEEMINRVINLIKNNDDNNKSK